MFFTALFFSAFLLLVQGSDVVFSTQIQGYTDGACTTVSGANVPIGGIGASGVCGAISVSGNVLTGLVTVTGNTGTLQACTCASPTSCGTTTGSPISITNGACEPASKVGLTGSFRSSWVPAVVVSSQGYSDTSCATVSGAPITVIIATQGVSCGSIPQVGLVGSAGISGNTATLQSCTCASSTSCGTTVGGPITITNGACEPASKLSLTGSFKATWTVSGGATTAPATTAPASGGGSSNPCFHTDTVITYAGKEHTFDEIRAHPECSIPHVVRAHGVIVTAKCGVAEKTLKLTDGHLVYTQRGLQAAGDLKPGQDTVYADLAETTKCEVVSVTKETQQHDYFGLNCINSQVLASGLKSSTFEKLHSVPAFWMQVMGRVLGIKRASAMGDYIADLVHKMNLI